MNDKLYDLLMLENYEGIYEGSIKEDGDNWEYHAEWYLNELLTIAEHYELQVNEKLSDENIREIREEIKNFLLESITVVDVRKIGTELANELKKDIVDESDIDEACDMAWMDEKDGLFTHTYDTLKKLGCKIKTYNGNIEE